MNALQEIKVFTLVDRDGVLLSDSRQISEALKVEHESYIKLVRTYQVDIEKHMGLIRFEIGEIKGRGQPEKYCLLTEDQAIYTGTLCRNTTTVIQFKAKLVLAFQNARRAAQQITKELSRKDLALLVIKAEEELEQANAKLIEQQPKVELADQCLIAVNSRSMGDTAKVLGIGRNTIFEFLRNESILMQTNIPYQKYISAGWFEVKITSKTQKDVVVNYPVTMVLPKGLEKIRELLFGRQAA